MRKALVVVVLIAAAFAGGTLASGSRPPWLQAALKGQWPGAGSIVALDGELPKAPGAEPEPPEPVPAAPLRPLVVGNQVIDASAPQPKPRPSPAPAPAELDARALAARVAPKAPAARAEPTPTRAEEPASPPPLAPVASAEGASKVDRAVKPVALDVDPARPEDQVQVRDRDKDKEKLDDWSALHRRMRELGVTRFAIEGEQGRPVRFRCLIPLAGRRAITQQFEAEGDDELQAAEAALHRVELWRATEKR